jgi:hypothetical protein
MMSDYSGYDRPFPTWFPYLVAAIIVIGAAAYALTSNGKAPPSGRMQDNIDVARNRPVVPTHRRT